MITILCLHTLFFKENKMSILIENKKVKENTEKFENIIVKDISNNIFVVLFSLMGITAALLLLILFM